jgi:hypothetical protein
MWPFSKIIGDDISLFNWRFVSRENYLKWSESDGQDIVEI